MAKEKKKGTTRRRFLIGTAVVAGGLFVGYRAFLHRDPTDPAKLLDPENGEVALNAWVKIGKDGAVTIAVPRSEMGQGVYTSLPMILAEELDADFDKVSVIPAKVDHVYANRAMMDDVLPVDPHSKGMMVDMAKSAGRWMAGVIGLQATGGSTSIRAAWEPMREAGAMARELLKLAAAQRLNTTPDKLRTEKGEVIADDGARIAYGELADAAATMTPPDDVKLKSRADYSVIGTPAKRLDLPGKVDGTAEFGMDVKLPGMLYGAVRHGPEVGSVVDSFDQASVMNMPGVKKVVEVPGGIAVLADSTWRAKKAVEALDVKFRATLERPVTTEGIYDQYRSSAIEEGYSFQDDGETGEVLQSAVSVIEAKYTMPFLAHATMEPMNATALLSADKQKLEIWAPTQSPMISRWRASSIVDLPVEQVDMHVTYLGGGFGRRVESDFTEQAVAAAAAVPGTPVKLIWSREEDMQHDVYRPATQSTFRAVVNNAGMPVAWYNQIVGPSHSAQATQRFIPQAAGGSPDRTTVDGAAWLPYAVENVQVEHVLSEIPVRIGFWRSVGHSYNGFYTESFVDELAHAAGKDPYEYRRALLVDKPRYRRVLDKAAQAAGWGKALPDGHAHGISLHESFGAIVAQVTEVSLIDGEPKVHRVTCAIDVGTVINPDTVVAQMESGIVYGLSAALWGEITFADGRVEQGNFPDYPVVRFTDMPEIETIIIDSDEKPGGAGEPGTPPVAAAVSNALFALTGKRARQMPLSKTDWTGAGV